MCNINVSFLIKSKEKMLIKSIDIIEYIGNKKYRLIDIFGNKMEINGKIEKINLSEGKILFK